MKILLIIRDPLEARTTVHLLSGGTHSRISSTLCRVVRRNMGRV